MNNFYTYQYRRLSILLYCLLFVFFNYQIAVSQNVKDNRQTKKESNQKKENPNIIRWRIFLDSLAQEAVTVSPEERRPFAIVEVANAYWEIDREATQTLYNTALDKAWSLVEKDKKKRPVLNYVLSSATKLDSNLAKILTKRLIDKQDSDSNKDDISSATALDILKEDANRAALLAEAFAPNGLQNGTAAFLIYRLAAQDVQLSNRVYSVYLNKVVADQNIPIEWAVQLGGYAFGYAEFYSVSGSGQLSGATFPNVKGLSPNSNYINTFLNLAYQRTARSIELRRTAVGEELEKLNYSILFSLEYLMPEVARFAPNTLTLWQQLYQQGIVGTTLQQNQQIAIHIQSINQSRVRAQQYSDSPQASETEAEASLEKVEQLVGTCQRDAVYSKAALIFSSRKKFQRAKEIAGNIEDMRQSENVKEIIFYDSILEDIEKGSFNEFEEKLKKINSSELKEIIYIEAAKELLKGNNKIDGTKYIYEAVNIAEKISEPEKRSGFLFALASILLKDDPIAAQGIINNAIKTLNKMEPTDLGRFFIQISIPLSCEGEDKNWYGDSVTIANSNVFDSISLFSKHNPDDARQIAENIDDKASKIRALAIITKIALAKAKTQK